MNQIFPATEGRPVSPYYYAIGSTYYIVVVRRERGAPDPRSEFTPVAILDRELKIVDILAM